MAFPRGKKHGYFTTVWQHNGQRWRWVYDGGNPAAGPVPIKAKAQTYRASCSARAPGAPTIARAAVAAKATGARAEHSGRGQSADRTLGWEWAVEKDGARHLRVLFWNGSQYSQALYDDIPAPPGK